jgi:hypothetical protein
MKRLITAARHFVRAHDGNMSLEFMLILPFLVWAHMGLYVFWDIFRTQNAIQKMAYSLSDTLSRQMGSVRVEDLIGLSGTKTFLSDNHSDVSLRITSIFFTDVPPDTDPVEGYHVLWSYSDDSTVTSALSGAELAQLVPSLPTLSDGESLIVVEATVQYNTAYNISQLENFGYTCLVVTRPRFVPKIALEPPGGVSIPTTVEIVDNSA